MKVFEEFTLKISASKARKLCCNFTLKGKTKLKDWIWPNKVEEIESIELNKNMDESDSVLTENDTLIRRTKQDTINF